MTGKVSFRKHKEILSTPTALLVTLKTADSTSPSFTGEQPQAREHTGTSSRYINRNIDKGVATWAINMTSNKVSKRAVNYTNREIHIIMEEYIRRKNILENNSSPQQNMEQKRKAWLEIAEHVNVISPTKRTYTEVRRKVSDMKSSAKRKMLRYLKQSLSEESKCPLIKPQIDERLLEILHENGVIPPYKNGFVSEISENEKVSSSSSVVDDTDNDPTYDPVGPTTSSGNQGLGLNRLNLVIDTNSDESNSDSSDSERSRRHRARPNQQGHRVMIPQRSRLNDRDSSSSSAEDSENEPDWVEVNETNDIEHRPNHSIHFRNSQESSTVLQ
ncbi:Nuclear apoptosis inducing factor 1 [Homalodisca vitripennis]|nr:Nuclear apoptosis inducing factor 1 [Homalodisca vitripennis]